ncbi:hypothetical protein ACFPIK_06865 [Algoriphagus aquatilis]|uniref:tRNA (Guanine-N1)-methyltransferase n=1 Tax=Algoriphagus aquatilis TaxID=490186 RepID=A0ABW0BUE5_9BACT
MRFSVFTALVVFFIFHLPTYAQDTTSVQNSLNSGTITSQFDYLYRVSNGFQEYEVVKKANLEKLKTNVLDSVRVLKKEIADLKLKQSSVVDSLANFSQILEQANQEKEAAILEKDSFSFLGFAIEKNLYSTLMWLLVVALAGAMAFFSVQYFRSFGRVRKAQKDLEDVQAEFDQHRKNALERERKLKRELIDAQMGKN